MITTYAVSLPTKKWSEEIRQACNDKIKDWLNRYFSADRMPANMRIRVRQSPDDEVFRAEISETFKATGSGRTTTITIAPHRGQLVFDVRMRHITGKDSVVPRRPAEAPPKALLQLCSEISQMLEVYDAERRIAPVVRIIATSVDGQALGADSLDAPSRRLPIIIEYTAGKNIESSLTAPLAHDLLGIAHIAHVTTPDALKAFNAHCGAQTLSEQYITIMWPKPVRPTVLEISQPKREQIATMIIDAATMQPELPVQAPPRTALSRQVQSPVATDTNIGADIASLKKTVDLLHKQIDEKQVHIDQLDEELAELDEQNDALIDDLEEGEQKIAVLVEKNTSLQEDNHLLIAQSTALEETFARKNPNAIPKTVEQAVRKAKQECVNLVFLDSAFETAKQLHRWGTTPLLVLNDLRKLDLVVQEWRKNAFSSAGLVSYMRDQHGLVYASGIGENTAQKYAADYTAVYLGKPVLLQAHLKRGKRTNITRIYMHVDNANKTIVIGLVVAHGQYGNS
jgi:hypothetical protein